MADPQRNWAISAANIKDRLQEPIWWFPYPALISFGLVLTLTAHVVSGTNPRMGNPADIISFPAPARKDSAIWLSATPIDDKIVVTTSDRRIFRWSQKLQNVSEVEPLVRYLKERVAAEITSAALMGRAFTTQTSAVIASDQRLKYLHIRPLLYALAEAGIAQYAFETQTPVLEGAGTAQSHLDHAPGGGHAQ